MVSDSNVCHGESDSVVTVTDFETVIKTVTVSSDKDSDIVV